MEEVFTAKEAIDYIAEHFGITSMYALSKALSDETLTVQPIQISNYLKGKSMSQKVASRFEDVFGVVITNISDRGALRKDYNR